MILVSFAVPFESEAFRRRAASRKVRIVHTGVGCDRAEAALRHAIAQERPAIVVSSGFAGGLACGLSIGDVLVEGAKAGRRGRFATSDRILATSTEKRVFRDQTQADAVDMESDALRKACRDAGVPLIIVRAISDRVDDDLALAPELLEALADRPVAAAPRLAWALMRDGSRRQRFFRMLRDCRAAQAALARELERLLPLLEKGEPVGS